MTTIATLSVLALALTSEFSAATLDSALRAEAGAGFSGVVRVAHDDSVDFERAYGSAAAAPVPAGELAFWIASDSKQFTAAAIVRLEEAGRLRVSDRIDRYFPRAPADKRAITIHQLLTHTSGLPLAYRADGIADRDEAVAAILALGLRSAPGEKYSYSNDGYTLLAAIVEVASGISFDSYLLDSLFRPARLRHTGIWGHEDPRVTIAPVAEARRASRQKSTIYRDGHSVANWGYRGCTGVYSTTADLDAWVRALRAGRVLSPPGLKKLVGRHVLVREDSSGQIWAAYGWGTRVEAGKDVSYGHAGGEDWLGHSSVLRWTPSGDCVVVLANSGDSEDAGWASRANRAVRRVLDPSRRSR